MASQIAPNRDRRIPAILPHPEKLGFWLMVALIGTATWLGWQNRELTYLEAESGLGYALGIIGGAAMLLLLLYPLRKRLRCMGNLGSVRRWFQIHMVCGALGPVIILYHANFSLGSTNSTVALFSMLIVAGSGLAGRYLFHRIAFRKTARMHRLQAFRANPRAELRTLNPLLEALPELRSRLDEFAGRALDSRPNNLAALLWLVQADLNSRRLRQYGNHELNLLAGNLARQPNWTQERARNYVEGAREEFNRYVSIAREATEFACLQEMFSLWHHLHMPLFLMMVVTGITHVFAVHLY